MFGFIIIWKQDSNIWWNISGVSYIDAMKSTLSSNPEYFGVAFENYLEDAEIIKRGYHYDSLKDVDVEVFFPTTQQFEKCLNFHLYIFENTDQYIVFQINFITGKISQLERQDLV